MADEEERRESSIVSRPFWSSLEGIEVEIAWLRAFVELKRLSVGGVKLYTSFVRDQLEVSYLAVKEKVGVTRRQVDSRS